MLVVLVGQEILQVDVVLLVIPIMVAGAEAEEEDGILIFL